MDLRQFEANLQEQLAVDPGGALDARVRQTVSRQLALERRDAWWAFAGAAAAILALWANLSWSLSRGMTFGDPPPPPRAALVAQLRELLPELSEPEARRQVMLMRGAARLPDGNAVRRAAAMGITY